MQIVGNPDRTAPARVMGMTRQHVDHGDIAAFAESKINLGRDHAKKFRDQVNRLRERLDTYIDENPHFEIKKMILSGSLAKGTSLRTINDIDVAVYVAATEAPASIPELIQWLTERLRRAFPNFNPEQVQPQSLSLQLPQSASPQPGQHEQQTEKIAEKRNLKWVQVLGSKSDQR